MSEAASRRLFMIEFVLLALPALGFIAVIAIGGGAVGIAYLGTVTLASLFGGQSDALALLPILLAASAVWVAGLMAVLIAVKVSYRFWAGGRAALRAERRLFLRGLACAIAPLVVLAAFGWASRIDPQDPGVLLVVLVRASSLALLPPMLHLWLEMGAAPTAEVMR